MPPRNIFADSLVRSKLLDAVAFCGTYALERQGDVLRNYKSDGSVLTEADTYINGYLSDTLRKLYPSCSILSEESDQPPDTGWDYLFVLDPIDGTDAYSQGMPAWCIAAGILDADYRIVGGIVYAPRWGIGHTQGLFISRFPGEAVRCRDNQGISPKKYAIPPKQLVMCSTSRNSVTVEGFSGKIRSFGSTIIHLLSPAVHSHIDLAVFSPSYIWDIAAAHGIISSLGLDIQYLDGSHIDYRKLVHRERTSGYALAGTLEMIEHMRRNINIHR